MDRFKKIKQMAAAQAEIDSQSDDCPDCGFIPCQCEEYQSIEEYTPEDYAEWKGGR